MAFSFVAVSCLIAANASAEPSGQAPAAEPDSSVRRIVVLVQPIPWLIGAASGTLTPLLSPSFANGLTSLGAYVASGEYALNPKVSFSVGLALPASSLASQTGNTPGSPAPQSVAQSQSTFGVVLQPGASYFLVGRAPVGLWVGAQLELGYVETTATARQTLGAVTTSSATTTGGGVAGGHAMLGYTVAWDSGFTLQIGLGVGLAYTGANSTSWSPPASPGAPTPGGSVAFAGRASLGLGWNL